MLKRFREILEEQKTRVRQEMPMTGTIPNPQHIWNQALERALILYIDERNKDDKETSNTGTSSAGNKQPTDAPVGRGRSKSVG